MTAAVSTGYTMNQDRAVRFAGKILLTGILNQKGTTVHNAVLGRSE